MSSPENPNHPFPPSVEQDRTPTVDQLERVSPPKKDEPEPEPEPEPVKVDGELVDPLAGSEDGDYFSDGKTLDIPLEDLEKMAKTAADDNGDK